MYRNRVQVRHLLMCASYVALSFVLVKPASTQSASGEGKTFSPSDFHAEDFSNRPNDAAEVASALIERLGSVSAPERARLAPELALAIVRTENEELYLKMQHWLLENASSFLQDQEGPASFSIAVSQLAMGFHLRGNQREANRFVARCRELVRTQMALKEATKVAIIAQFELQQSEFLGDDAEARIRSIEPILSKSRTLLQTRFGAKVLTWAAMRTADSHRDLGDVANAEAVILEWAPRIDSVEAIPAIDRVEYLALLFRRRCSYLRSPRDEATVSRLVEEADSLIERLEGFPEPDRPRALKSASYVCLSFVDARHADPDPKSYLMRMLEYVEDSPELLDPYDGSLYLLNYGCERLSRNKHIPDEEWIPLAERVLDKFDDANRTHANSARLDRFREDLRLRILTANKAQIQR